MKAKNPLTYDDWCNKVEKEAGVLTQNLIVLKNIPFNYSERHQAGESPGEAGWWLAQRAIAHVKQMIWEYE